MIRKQCGCTSTSCGCCEGIQQLTPVRIYNRPGLTTIQERVGTHGEFLETMKARLATMRVDAPGADGQTLETFQPLQGLTTRNSTDPAIALLDGWAIVADVLTFYQERMANEGYLRTATERCSLVELSRLVGYTPRPGVAATVFFAYTMEDKQVDPVEIPTGSRAQSIPGPGELPQSFETSESLIARAAWNNLPVRLTKPQKITLENALSITTIYVAGINVNLKTGDLLLLTFGDNGPPAVVRTVASTEGQFPANRTAVHLQPVPLLVQTLLPALVTFLTEAQKKLTAASPGAARRMVARADTLVTEVYLGLPATPATWPEALTSSADGDPGPEINTLWTAFAARVDSVVQNPPVPGAGDVLTDPATFTPALLKPPIAQAANSLQLRRNLRTSFAPGQDANPQLLVSFAPQLQETFYTAWSSANVNAATPALMGVYALRASASLFGASVPRMATYNANSQLNTPDQWQE